MDPNDLKFLKDMKAHADKFATMLHEAQKRGYSVKVGWNEGKVEVFDVHQLVPVNLSEH